MGVYNGTGINWVENNVEEVVLESDGFVDEQLGTEFDKDERKESDGLNKCESNSYIYWNYGYPVMVIYNVSWG